MTASFTSFSLPASAVRWQLTGPPGPDLDLLIAGLVGAGVRIEAITPACAYRLDGPSLLLDVLQTDLIGVEGGITLAPERAPKDSVRLSTEATLANVARRRVVVHGGGDFAARFVVFAIDHGLAVESVGLARWSVSGRSSTLIEWLSAAWARPRAEVLEALALDEDVVAAEDKPSPPLKVDVVLPERKLVSDIERNQLGEIVKVTQLESSV